MAGVDVTFRGAEQLVHLAAAVKKYGDRELRKELLRGLRTASKPAIGSLRDSARETLPSSGGLADEVASSKIAARNKTSGSGAGIRIVGTGKAVHDIKATNEGQLRHPVFGHTGTWVTQSIEPGWWDKGMERAAPGTRTRLIDVMDDVARRIAGSV